MCDYFSRFSLHGLTRPAVRLFVLSASAPAADFAGSTRGISSARPESCSAAAIDIRCSEM